MSSLTLLVGFPGCGKSTFCQDYFMYHDRNRTIKALPTVIINPDAYRLEMTGKEFYAPAEDAVWSAVKLTARVLLSQGAMVVIDATNLTMGARSQWLRIAKEKNVPIYAYWMQTSFEECCARNAARSRVVPQTVLDGMKDTFVPPTPLEHFSAVMSVDKGEVEGSYSILQLTNDQLNEMSHKYLVALHPGLQNT